MGWRSDPVQGFWNWSLPCGRWLGVPVSMHWSLLLLTLFHAMQGLRSGMPWYWLPCFLVVPPLSVLLHELGHAGAARLAGGGCERIILWMFGGAAMCSAPARPWAQFAVAAAGPLVSLLLGIGCLLGVTAMAGRLTADVGLANHLAGGLAGLLAFAAWMNLALLLFNLLPCYPLDGGRMLRAILWPLTGRMRAVRFTLVAAYVCIAIGVLWALWSIDMLLLGLSLILLMAVLAERAMVRQGLDPEFGDELPYERGGTVWDRWQARRATLAAEREAAHAAGEQAELDRLLAKVSEHGLPALTAAERRTLQRISERERSRGQR